MLDHLQNSGVNAAKDEKQVKCQIFKTTAFAMPCQICSQFLWPILNLLNSSKRCANKLGCFIYIVLHEKI
jgi:hypothetical protein